MSYFGGTSTGAFSQLSSTPMMFDILAAQNIYGVNMATRATDTIYGFNSTADSAYLFSGSTASSAFCIWDGAGTDTIDVSGFAQNQLVNLCAGTFSDVGGLTGNVSIAIGCSIENAKGGSGSDVIFGNSLNNTITGGAGNDMLFGGAGSDTAIFSGARSNYVISSITDGWSVVDTDGTDQLFNFEYAQFSDQTITLASNSSYVITSYIKASFSENATGTVYAATATDVDAGATLSYSLGGADALLFNISSAGAVTFKAVPNYEAPADAGANNVYNVTVTASDSVNVSDAQAVAITVTDVYESLAGQSVIDLGSYGKLIAPVQVEGAWYYYWDRSGDGTNAGVDYTTHDVLDGIFTSTLSEVNAGTTGTGTDTTDLIRYANLNGVKVALPTHGGALLGVNAVTGFQTGTAVGASPDRLDGSNATNATYDDLLAIWDAYNGTGTGININGTPSGWQNDYYWSATPSAFGHAGVHMIGYVYPGGDNDGISVALQVL